MLRDQPQLTGLTPDELGMSETASQAKASKPKTTKQPQYQFDNSGDALSRIRSRQLPTLDLGQGAGTQRIINAPSTISGGAPKGTVQTAKYAGPTQAADYITQLQQRLGVQGPKSTIAATREAATRQLEQGTLEQAIRDQTQLAAQGQTTGARSQALSALRGQTLAGQKAQLEADLQQDEANRLAAYEAQLLGMAQDQGRSLTAAAQEEARARTQGSFSNAQAQAQRELQQAEMALRSGGALNTEEYKRRMAEYANALAKIQQQNTADVLEINKDAQTQANWMGLLGGVVDAGARVGAAYI